MVSLLSRLQLFRQLRVRVHIRRLIGRIHHHPRPRPGGLFHEFDGRVVHGDLLALAALGEPRRETRRLVQALLVRLLAVGPEDDVRPVDLLGVEPVVPLPRLLGGQAVVLQVVPAHGDAQAAGGAKLHGLGRRALHAVLGLPPAAEVARLHQLLADLFQIPVPLGAGDAVQHTVEIFQLALPLFQLERQHLQGRLGLGVALVILRRVLLGASRVINAMTHTTTTTSINTTTICVFLLAASPLACASTLL